MTVNVSSDDNLIDYYKRELRYLRHQGADFAKKYPKIAGRLAFNGHESPDPQVERLLESFSFQTARIQKSLDSEAPHVSASLLGLLYPQLLQPIPPASVAQFQPDPDQKSLQTGVTIPHHTEVMAHVKQNNRQELCRFRTAYPVELWPLKVEEAVFEPTRKYTNSRMFRQMPAVSGVLRIRLRVLGEANRKSVQHLSRLRFFLSGETAEAIQLYELIMGNHCGVVQQSESMSSPRFLGADAIKTVGFEADEALFPYPDNAHIAYRLLQEYFAFPEKFFFFDVDQIQCKQAESYIDLLILLKKTPPLELEIGPKSFALGCTPIVNLFERVSEPISIDHRREEYPLIVDARREEFTEIHSILSVSDSSSSNMPQNAEVVAPFFSFHAREAKKGQQTFWNARRVSAIRPDIVGSSLLLSFLDLDLNPSQAYQDKVLFARTLCTNRNLAESIPPDTKMQIEEEWPVLGIQCLLRPSTALNPPVDGPYLWDLIAQLSVGHLSLYHNTRGADALRGLLRTYSFIGGGSNSKWLDGLEALQSRSVMRRFASLGKGRAWKGHCQGTEITLILDREAFEGHSAFLLASVLNSFFALTTTSNSFTQLVLKEAQEDEPWHIWKPLMGRRCLV